MKISQYNWNWWFVVTIIVLAQDMAMAMCGEEKYSGWIMLGAIVSLLPCLYIGCKPSIE